MSRDVVTRYRYATTCSPLNRRRCRRFRRHFGCLWGYRRGCGGWLRADFLFRVAELLDLVQSLQFFVGADGEELDHRFGDPQAAFNFVHNRAGGVDHHQHKNAVVELAYLVSETALAPDLALRSPACRGD